MLGESFWVNQFDITINDVKRTINYVKEVCYPISIVDITKRVISGRLKYGEDLSQTVLSEWSGKDTVRLWDPAADWKTNDDVIVLISYYDSGNFKHKPVIGVIKEINFGKNLVCVKTDEREISYVLAEPDSENAIKWHNFVREVIAKYTSSSSLEDRVIAVFTEFGGKITSRVQEVLKTDDRFVSVDQFWFLSKLVEDLASPDLIKIYKILSSLKEPLTLGEISKNISLEESDELIKKFTIKKALLTNINLFTKIDSKVGNLYQAHIPEIENAQIVNYAYDPDTYEIICTPGDKLSQKTIDKLKEHGLLAGVISSQTEIINGS